MKSHSFSKFLILVFGFATSGIFGEGVQAHGLNPMSASVVLHQAILNNSTEEVRKAVVLAGVDINSGKDGKSPLVSAVLLKRANAVKGLLECGANANVVYLGLPIVHHAIRLGSLRSAILLVKRGGDFSGFSGPAKRNAMSYIINFFLENPHSIGSTFDEVFELIQELINHGYNINSSDCSKNIWYLSVRSRCDKRVFQIFIKNGANLNQIIIDSSQRTWTPLLRAIEHFNIPMVKFLLSAGADVNQKARPVYKSGPYTPLSYAISKGQAAMVELLMERGASL